MYQGFFINLDRNGERRTALTRHLEDRGAAARYQRFAAVDGRAVAHQYQTSLDPGNLGLWLTHSKLLEANRGSALHLHVIEDDTVFASNAVDQFDAILEEADSQIANWDLIFTDIHVPIDDVALFRKFSEMLTDWWQGANLQLLDLQYVDFACTSSFFLNRQSIDKYSKRIADQWALGLPIDIHLRDLVKQGSLKAYLTFPFPTSLSAHNLQSDIADEIERCRALATVYRCAFFQEADLSTLHAEVQVLARGAAMPPLTAIYMTTLLFRLSDQWVHY